jgi:hypothetical protein
MSHSKHDIKEHGVAVELCAGLGGMEILPAVRSARVTVSN